MISCEMRRVQQARACRLWRTPRTHFVLPSLSSVSVFAGPCPKAAERIDREIKENQSIAVSVTVAPTCPTKAGEANFRRDFREIPNETGMQFCCHRCWEWEKETAGRIGIGIGYCQSVFHTLRPVCARVRVENIWLNRFFRMNLYRRPMQGS